MMSALAEVTIPVTGEQVAVWLACLFFLVAGVNQVRRFMGRDKIDQPLRVALEKEFVARDEHNELRKAVDTRFSSAAASRKEIHGKLDEHNARIQSLETSDQHQTRLLHSIDGKLDYITKTLIKKN